MSFHAVKVQSGTSGRMEHPGQLFLREQVNGVTITEMGTQVEEEDEVRVDGEIIHPETEKK